MLSQPRLRLAALADHPADDACRLTAYGAVNAVVVAYVRSETSGHRMAERTIAQLTEAATDGRHPHIAALRLDDPESGEERLRRTITGILTGLLPGSR